MAELIYIQTLLPNIQNTHTTFGWFGSVSITQEKTIAPCHSIKICSQTFSSVKWILTPSFRPCTYPWSEFYLDFPPSEKTHLADPFRSIQFFFQTDKKRAVATKIPRIDVRKRLILRCCHLKPYYTISYLQHKVHFYWPKWNCRQIEQNWIDRWTMNFFFGKTAS